MIYFRCDGNSVIGGGHVMRCLSIANALEKQDVKCSFILADSEFEQTINCRGFKTIILNSKYYDLENEVEDLVPILQKDASILIVDTYYATKDYLMALKKVVKLVYIDDIFSFPYPVDILINYNIYAYESRYHQLYNSSEIQCPDLLLGTKYAPLRNEFIDVNPKEVKKDIKDILISTGTSDTQHVCLKLLDEILASDVNYHFHLLVGSKNSDYPKICEKAQNASNIHIYFNYDKVSELMSKCDVALAAAGSTIYELFRTGTPTITYLIADNQKDGMDAFEKQGLAISLGDLRYKELHLSIIVKSINNYYSYDNRIKLSKKLQEVVDGQGASRIASYIVRHSK